MTGAWRVQAAASACLLAALLAGAPAARADEPAGSAPKLVQFEGVVRAGFIGVDGHYGGMFGVDAGARFSGRVFFGGFFTYGVAAWDGYPCWGACEHVTRQLGLEVQAHTEGPVDLWAGLGTGYQWGSYGDTKGSSSDGVAYFKYESFLALLLQCGVDFPVGALHAGLFVGIAASSGGGNSGADKARFLGGARLAF